MRAPRSRWRTWSVSGATVRPADLLLQALGCALRLVLRLSPTLAKLVDACLLGLSEIEPVDRLGQAEGRVDGRDHDPGIDRDQLDPDHRDTHVRIDHETLVEDQIDDVRQPARTRSPLQVVARRALGGYGHRILLLLVRCFAPLRPPLGALVAALGQLVLEEMPTLAAAIFRAAATDTGHATRLIGQLLGEVPAGAHRRASLVWKLLCYAARALGGLAQPRQQRVLDELRALFRHVPRAQARAGGDHRHHQLLGDASFPAHDSSESSSSLPPIRPAISFASAAATPTAAAVAAPFAVVLSAGESGVSSSSTPSIAPSVIFSAPFSCSSGSPPNSVSFRSRRLTASAKRRYVSTLAITIRASIVISSIPITAIRTYASITRRLSRIRSTTSASPLGLRARCR